MGTSIRALKRWFGLGLLVAGAAFLTGMCSPAAAKDEKGFRLALPVDCMPGTDCWLVNYVDINPSKGIKDYTCRKGTYNGNKGIDFAIRDRAAMRQGVKVLAAAPGTVAVIRDGMSDVAELDALTRDAVRGVECGNAVKIDHPGGWATIYCHMQKNSVQVKKGDHVETGTELGSIGQSGLAQFPHLNLQVIRDGSVVDPFLGPNARTDCRVGKAHLWKPDALAKIPYAPTAIYNAGFAANVPKKMAILDGLFQDDVLSSRAPALLLWADIFHVESGDNISFEITGPDGKALLTQSKEIPKTRRQDDLFWAGKKRTALFWPKGVYRGTVRLERKAASGKTVVFEARRKVTLR